MGVTRRLTFAIASVAAAVTLAAAPAPALAQEGAAGGNAGMATQGAERPISINFRDIPLRDAVQVIFAGSGLQFSIDPNVQNVPINLQLTNVPLRNALRAVLRQAAIAQPGLTYSVENGIYTVKVRPPAPIPTETPTVEEEPERTITEADLVWEKIPVQYTDILVFVSILGGSYFPSEMDIKGGMGGMGGGMMGGMGGGFGGGMMGGMGGGMMGGMGGMMGGMGGFGGGMGGMMGGMGGMGGGMGGFGGGMGGFGGGMGGFGGGMGGIGGGMGGGMRF